MDLREDLKLYKHPVPRFYLLSTVGGLLAAALLLAERGLSNEAMLLILLGVLGLLTRYRSIPLLVLGFVAVILLARGQGYDLLTLFYKIILPWSRLKAYYGEYRPNPALDVVFALAMLIYLQGQYRLCGLLTSALPGEATEGEGERRRPIPRDPGPEDSPEGYRELTALAGCVALAIAVWMAVSMIEPRGPIALPIWRGMLLAWLLATLLSIGTTIARTLFWRASPPEVQRLFLQDTLWRETRGDQARIQYWLTAARLRAQKRKERT